MEGISYMSYGNHCVQSEVRKHLGFGLVIKTEKPSSSSSSSFHYIVFKTRSTITMNEIVYA